MAMRDVARFEAPGASGWPGWCDRRPESRRKHTRPARGTARASRPDTCLEAGHIAAAAVAARARADLPGLLRWAIVAQGLLRIGTSGWSYPGGRGTWNGVFYPVPPVAGDARPRGPSRGGFDELAYYAERFDTVEVNSTFYRVPAPRVAASWARRTPAGFEFSVKLYQKFTHPAMFAAATEGADPTVRAADVDAFRRALEPLAAAAKLGPLLAQFPPSFTATPEAFDYLGWLLGALRDYRLAVELRHRTWSDRRAETLGLLGEHDAAWVQIDEPKFRFSVRQDFRPNVQGFAYLRLHGRNAAQWWDHDASEDRYNYLYTAEELESFAEAAEATRPLVRKLYLYLNNHFEAKAVANAVMLKQRLGAPIAGEYAPAFVERYPALQGVVRVAPTSPRLL